MDSQPALLFDAEVALLAERPHLVRLCKQLSGDHDVAEDLAQEVLLVAWRNRVTLHEPGAYHAWLNGIARNVCLRWQRQRVREQQRRAPPTHARRVLCLRSLYNNHNTRVVRQTSIICKFDLPLFYNPLKCHYTHSISIAFLN
jgi:DNA-directed RNA polymerase specialized sigma24 family protein